MFKVVRIFELEDMPFDKNGLHATGNLLELENGHKVYEYQGEEELYDYTVAEYVPYCEL